MNNWPVGPSPDPKIFVSRKNLLQGNTKPFPLERLMAFGTAATCYIPLEKRRGGKEPAQRRSFQGVLVGYEEGMPAYRVWDLEAHTVKAVSYVFTICHEGYYPLRDKTHWDSEWHHAPYTFSPVQDGLLTLGEWSRYDFDDEDAMTVMADKPDLVLDARDLPTTKTTTTTTTTTRAPPEKNKIQVEVNPASRQKFLPPLALTSPSFSTSSSSISPPSAKEVEEKYANDAPNAVSSPSLSLPVFSSTKTKNFWQQARKNFDAESKFFEAESPPELGTELKKPISVAPPKTYKGNALSLAK